MALHYLFPQRLFLVAAGLKSGEWKSLIGCRGGTSSWLLPHFCCGSLRASKVEYYKHIRGQNRPKIIAPGTSPKAGNAKILLLARHQALSLTRQRCPQPRASTPLCCKHTLGLQANARIHRTHDTQNNENRTDCSGTFFSAAAWPTRLAKHSTGRRAKQIAKPSLCFSRRQLFIPAEQKAKACLSAKQMDSGGLSAPLPRQKAEVLLSWQPRGPRWRCEGAGRSGVAAGRMWVSPTVRPPLAVFCTRAPSVRSQRWHFPEEQATAELANGTAGGSAQKNERSEAL